MNADSLIFNGLSIFSPAYVAREKGGGIIPREGATGYQSRYL